MTDRYLSRFVTLTHSKPGMTPRKGLYYKGEKFKNAAVPVLLFNRHILHVFSEFVTFTIRPIPLSERHPGLPPATLTVVYSK